MILTHLSLTNFRNYTSLELDLPPHLVVFQGENAQGKSNLLEAIYILATSRSPRAANERELINWSAFEEENPVCRVAANVERTERELTLEIAIRGNASSPGGTGDSTTGKSGARAPAVHKRIRVNGVAKRAIDLIGQINVVPFSALDINIIGGEPSLRRRYLDITNSQIDRQYLRHLQRYQRVLWQRNRLLSMIAEHRSSPDELAYWNQELVQTGAYITLQRKIMVAGLEELACNIHDELSGGQGNLSLIYLSNIGNGLEKVEPQLDDIAETFNRSLQTMQDREIAQGVSLIGPHRDELRFLADDIDLGVYGSRGQQRTAALSLKLAEVNFILEKTGDHPILLLDDVLSELDAQRRSHLLHAVAGYRQVLITATDLDHFEPNFLRQAELMEVKRGFVEPLRT